VLNPPGGRSNNIFGGAEEPKAAGKSTQQENQQTPTEPHPVTINAKPKEIIATNIFGADTTNHPKQNKSRRGFNPITGANYEDDEPEKTKPAAAPAPAPVEQPAQMTTQPNPVGLPTGSTLHTSSRVLQPPGGRSTKLW